MNLATLLPAHARYRPNFPAIKVSGSEYTFAELNAEVDRIAIALLAAGITKGDKVSIVMTNLLEFVQVYLALAKTGIVVVPVSTLLNEMGLKRLLTDPDSVLVVADASYAGILRDIRCNLPAIELDRFILAGVD